jgi:SagB-type dehydrogenase family enzyme
MNPELLSAKTTSGYYRVDPELAATMPGYPKLLDGLVSISMGSRGVAFLGTRHAQVVKGAGSHVMLGRLLPLLDGRHSYATIKASLAPRLSDSVDEMLVLLSHRGLLEDGAAVAERAHDAPAPSPVASYLGRHLNITRQFRSADAALASVHACHLLVIAPAKLRPALGELFAELGLRRLTLAGSEFVDLRGVDYVFALAADGDDLAAVADAARASRVPLFFARLGSAAIQVGPLFDSAQSASYQCMLAVRDDAPDRDRIGAADSEHEAAFWLSYIYHQFVNTLGRLDEASTLNAYREFARDEQGYHCRLVEITQMPGLAGGPLAAYPPLAGDALLAWELHSRIRMPPKALLAPGTHLRHYSSGNLRTLVSKRPVLYADLVLPLPEAVPASITGPARLTLAGLSYLLKFSYGQHDERLLAPSGGGLGSPDAFLMIHDITGLRAGCYRYRCSEHAIEYLGAPSLTLFMGMVGQRGSPPRQCYLVGAAAYGRVSAKYAESAFKMINLDAGVMQCYTELVAERAGIACDYLSDIDSEGLTELLGIVVRYFGLTHAFALGQADSDVPSLPRVGTLLHVRGGRPPRPARSKPRMPEARAAFEAILLKRRAVRRFQPQPARCDVLLPLLRSCAGLLGAAGGADGQPTLRLWVVLPYGGVNGDATLAGGIHAYDAAGATLRLRCGFDATQASQFSNQNSLAAASAMVIVTVDMARSLAGGGGAAYRQALQETGRALTLLWLRAEAAGYRGTISGGVLDDGLMRHAGCDGYGDAALAMFVLGQPSDAQAPVHDVDY